MSGPEATGPEAFLRACTLDVAVRKPGNVSHASPGHGMQAAQFIASAHAAAAHLFQPGARVGRRIEAAVSASWEAAGCNTNLGIVLLCAPLAAAAESRHGGSLRQALQRTLQVLDIDDAAAAFRAITQANPGGLGDAPQQDVHAPPSIGLRDAMALAADRDRIARQYRDGFAELFDIGLAALPPAFPLMADADPRDAAPAVQAVYLAWLATHPDSHIVRKHGEAVAHSVMSAAQGWQARAAAHGGPLDADPAYIAWDEGLKARRINPGTSADLTVATLLLSAWHGT